MLQSKLYQLVFNSLVSGNPVAGEHLDLKTTKDFSTHMESIQIQSGFKSGKAEIKDSLSHEYKTFTSIVSNFELENGETYVGESLFSKSQLQAGFASYITDHSKSGMTDQLFPRTPTAPAGYEVVQGSNTPVLFDRDSISSEAFDGADKTENIYLSMVISMGAARQEDFVEMFCPTVPVKATEGGVYVATRFPSFVKEYYMDRSSTSLVEQNMGRKPVIKHVYDPEVMGQDRTLVVPSWYGADGKTESADALAWLVSGVKVQNNDRGEAITSGFYKVSTDINIMQLGQSQLDLTRKGQADITDNLLPGIIADKLLLKLKPESASSDTFIPVSLAGVNGKAFTDPQSGHNKQISLNIIRERIAIKIGVTNDYDNKPITFAGATNVTSKTNYSLVYEITVHGSANLQTGTVNVSVADFKLVDIITPSGISTAGDYTKHGVNDLAEAFTTSAQVSEVAGYSLIAYRANTNLRTTGQLIQSDGYAFYYPVAFRSPVTLQSPISAYTGSDCDFEELSDAINSIVFASNFIGVRKILQFKDNLKAAYEMHSLQAYNPSEDYNSALLHPYFGEGSIDLSTLVDSIKSQDRTADIRAALRNRIREDALKMLSASNYKVAFDALYSDRRKITVLVATHYHLGQYLCHENEDGTYTDVFQLTADMNCKVVTTMNPALKNPVDQSIDMLMTFSVTDKVGSIDTVQKLHPGFRLYAPVVTVSVDSVSTNNTVKKITQLVPKYEHHLTMKVMHAYKVTNLESVLGKVNVNFKVQE